MKVVLIGTSLLLSMTHPLWAGIETEPVSFKNSSEIVLSYRKVTVVVNDQAGPIIGANVIIKGTTYRTRERSRPGCLSHFLHRLSDKRGTFTKEPDGSCD